MDHIISADRPASEDILGRERFAAQIVKSISTFFGNQKESLVVGISGKWGSGKSTLLDYIKNHLDVLHKDNGDNYKVLSFNSWGHTAGNDLERGFLEKVVQTVSGLNWKDKVLGANDKFKKYLGYLDYVKFVGIFNSTVKNVLDVAEEYRKNVEAVSLEEVRLEANKLLEESGTRLYILIDDLDRLTPKEVTTLFRILKVNLNLSNTIFMVAYDKQVVVQALEREYGVDGEK
ncbi:P-loop NTPase fold protein [Pedobacter miscanthi]|uniref:KAP family P-loop NTPase fold protein n=1 Tax=Pedobacter miscanthi TaxID=2259170 RepID=UPI00292DF442|nr:P-loop NTPase fold protein [Pedobacter miscanthi]